ncbi:MAG: bifunctional DNA-formamidopyrimidine glycosylase/DNA-(apurinic or apyrimidinic site) lyase [Terracidiphilus sp.]
MPELPEVETVARGVHDRVRGDRIVEVWLGRHREPFKSPAGRMVQDLEGKWFRAVVRHGKHIVCELSNSREGKPEAQWIVHLGMTGRLVVTTPDAPIAPHTHARLTMASGREIRFVDPRRFGRLEFRDLNRDQSFAAPGEEPLDVDGETFAALFRGRRLAVKAALLNQSLLAGVGNIYADESLFRAGLRPRRLAGRLTRAELDRLRKALRDVLLQAIASGGSSVSDYVDANGVRGFFQLEHRVYQRGGQPCLLCGTSIRRIVVAGRSTHYCPQCQR